MERIVILGATGGCVDILDTIIDINAAGHEPVFDVVGFLDDRNDLKGATVLGARVLGPFSRIGDFADCKFVTGIGSPYNYWRRGTIIRGLGLLPDRFATVIHPTASISRSASIGPGSVVHQHVTVTTGARIGAHVLILPNSVISHGCTIGDYSIMNAGACLAGEVNIGESCYIGARSAVRQNLSVGAFGQVGMGAVVLVDVPVRTIVVGNPARVLREIPEF